MMSGTLGFTYVELDAVDVADYASVMMSGWVHVEATSWGDGDMMKVWATDESSGREAEGERHARRHEAGQGARVRRAEGRGRATARGGQRVSRPPIQ